MKPRSKGKVLIVDDNDNIRLYTATILKKDNFEVILASNRLNAIKTLQKNNDIKVILLDIMMPLMNGYDFLKILRNYEKYNKLKVCVMSAKGNKKDIVKAMTLGANDYLVKVLDKEVLLSRINKLFNISPEQKFCTLKTNLNANLLNSKFNTKFTITEFSEQHLTIETTIEPIIGAQVVFNVPMLNKIFQEDTEFVCTIEYVEKKNDLYYAYASFTGLSETSSMKLRKMAINKEELYELY